MRGSSGDEGAVASNYAPFLVPAEYGDDFDEGSDGLLKYSKAKCVIVERELRYLRKVSNIHDQVH